jgi:hypothetical protein
MTLYGNIWGTGIVVQVLRDNVNQNRNRLSVGDHALIKVCATGYRSHKKKMINNARLIKLTCSWYLELKSASPWLLGPVDFG